MQINKVITVHICLLCNLQVELIKNINRVTFFFKGCFTLSQFQALMSMRCCGANRGQAPLLFYRLERVSQGNS